MRIKFTLTLFSLIILTGCAVITTKGEAFPEMYIEKPVSILVLPPINESTAADAKEYYSTTIAEPLSFAGYYVYPIEVINEILKKEGIYDTELISDLNPSKFREYFGADAVLFTKIIAWNTSYFVIGGNVKVHVDFSLVSTKTGKTLWSYNDQMTVDTSAGENELAGVAGLLVQLAETALKTAAQDYIPIAKRVNQIVLATIPFGIYHIEHGSDQNSSGVNKTKIKWYFLDFHKPTLLGNYL